jgi:hypothetical protein
MGNSEKTEMGRVTCAFLNQNPHTRHMCDSILHACSVEWDYIGKLRTRLMVIEKMFKLSTFAILAAALLISIAPQAYAGPVIGGGHPLPQICSLNLGNLPRPSGPTPSVTVSGAVFFVTVRSACNSEPVTRLAPESMACAYGCTQTVEYLVALNGTMYRIVPRLSAMAPGIGTAGRSAPALSNGSQVTVTGFLLAPSGWVTNAWTPQLAFAADILMIGMVSSS